jgi:hypothetical protein
MNNPNIYKNHNDYSVTVFFNGRPPIKHQYVDDLRKYSVFLNNTHSSWLYMNVYNRRSGNFIKRYYFHSEIPSKPRF